MINKLNKHYIDTDKITQFFAVLDIKEWKDYNTGEVKGVVFQVFFRNDEESFLLPVKILGKTVEECKKFNNKNVKFKNMFVVPWVKRGSSFVNYSYQADDVIGA